jgi:transcriptional regulator with XRE-family HTH domain
MTQQEFAEVADMSEKFIQQIEAKRKKEILVSTVERLAAAFSLELHEFLAPELPTGLQASQEGYQQPGASEVGGWRLSLKQVGLLFRVLGYGRSWHRILY